MFSGDLKLQIFNFKTRDVFLLKISFEQPAEFLISVILDLVGIGIVEVVMAVEMGIISHNAGCRGDPFNEAACGEGIQHFVDRGGRDIRIVFTDQFDDLIGGRMVIQFDDRLEDGHPLRRYFQTAFHQFIPVFR